MGFNIPQPPTEQPKQKTVSKKQAKRTPRKNQQNITGSSYNNTTRNNARQAVATQKRRRKKRNYTIHYIILITVLIITFAILSFTVFFNIKTITVNGKVAGVDNNSIIGQTSLKIGDSLLLINKEKIENQIMTNNFLLDGVEVQRNFPSGISLNLVEAKPTIAVKFERQYYFFSEAMRLMKIEKTNVYPDITCYVGVKMPEGIAPGAYLKQADAEGLELCMDIRELILQKNFNNITYVDITSDINVSLFYKEQIQIKVGTITDLSYKLDSASRVITQKLTEEQVGVLDVQLERKAYFRQGDISLP